MSDESIKNTTNSREGLAASTDSRSLPAEEPAQARPRAVDLRDLMGSARAIVLDHNGEHYHLRITSRGKLILTK